MTREVNLSEAMPGTIFQNDTVTWGVSFKDFPASVYTLDYFFAAGPETPTKVSAVAVTDDFAVTWTCPLPPADYNYFVKATANGLGRVILTGRIKVLPDPSVAVDRRSHAEICLSALEALIVGKLLDPSTASIAEMEVFEGFKAKYTSPDDLITLRNRFRSEVRFQRSGQLVRKYPARRF